MEHRTFLFTIVSTFFTAIRSQRTPLSYASIARGVLVH